MKDEIKFPQVWVGFIFPALFFAVKATKYIANPTAAFVAISLTGTIFWFFCIYRIHKILFYVSAGKYPISAGKAVGFSFIPLYNIYWLFRWPSEIAKFVNTVSQKKQMNIWVPGICLFIAFITYQTISVVLGFVINFSALLYLARTIEGLLGKVSVPLEDYSSNYKAAKFTGWMAGLLLLSILIPLLAAIAIPNLLKARIAANEARAESAINNISRALEDYAVKNNKNYPSDEKELIAQAPPYFNKFYHDKTIQGYKYRLSLNPGGYEVTAAPEKCKITGTRILKVSTGGSVSKEDCK